MSPVVKGGGEENGGGPGDVKDGGSVANDEVLESGERLVSSSRNAGRGAVQNGSSFAMKKRGGREWETYFEEIRAGKRRILRSDVARLRAEAEAARKRFEEEGGARVEQEGDCFKISFRNGSDWIKVGEVVNAVKKKILWPDVAKQTEDSDAHMENAMEEALLNDDQLRCHSSVSKRGEGEGIEAEKKRLVNSCVLEQMKEASADEQKTAEESDTSEMKAIEVAEAVRKKITEECDSDMKKVTEEVGSDERELTKEADISMKEVMGDVTSGAFEYGSICAIIARNDRDLIKCGDEKEVEVSGTMGSDAAKRRGETDVGVQETVDYRAPEADQNSNNSINKSNRKKWMNCEFKVSKKRITSLDITKRRKEGKPDRKEVGEETDANLKKVIEDNDMSKKEAAEETAPGADHHGKNATIIGRICSEQKKCNYEIEAENKRIMKVDVANQRGEVDAVGKEVTEEAASGIQHNRKRSVMTKSNAADHVKSKQEIKVEKRITRSAAAKQRKEVDADKRKVKEEAIADNKKAMEEFAHGADQNGNISTICKRIGKEQIKCEEEINIENKQIVGMDVDKHSEEVSTNKKKVKKETGSGTDAEDINQLKHVETKIENKWPMGLNFANLRKETNTHKKKVMDSVSGFNQNEKSFTIKKMNDPEQIDFEETEIKNKTSVKSDNEKQNKEVDTIKKKVVNSGLDRKRGREASDSKTSWKKIKTESSKRGHDRTAKCGGKNLNIDSSNSQGLRPKSPVPAGGQKDDLEGKTEQRSIKGQGRGARNKKMDGFEKAHIPREGKENKKNGGFHIGSQSTSKRLILSVKKTVLRKSCGARMGPKSLSPKVEPRNVKSSNGKSKVMVKREYSSAHLRKKNKVTASEGRKEAKEKVREQIKNILLSAGWRIDLRPRKGRNYEDSVYISPRGSGYWSITKAYEVFQNEFDHAYSEKGKDVSRNSFKSFKRSICNHKGRGFPFSAIPMEDLSMLKREIAKKRSKEEHKKRKKKTGNAKFLKCKYDGGETNGKVKENGTVGSSSKGIACHELKKLHSGRYKKRQGRCALLVCGSNQEGEAGTVGYVPYVWKRTILSWMIDLGIVSSNGKVNYMNQKRTEAMLEGWIMRDGIKCGCCSKILAVSMFEIHAGSKLCHPYQNIFVEETGVSLFQCLLDAWKRHDDSERQSFYTVDIDGDDANDDTCGICGDGGDLICCDSCPSTFHLDCLGIQMLPPGDWHCMNCSCRYCGASSCSDAQENGGTVPPTVTCSLCEEKYHQICAAKVDDVSVSSSLSCVPFCGHSCRELFEQLQRLLGVKNDLEAGFSWTLVRRFDEDSPEQICGLDLRVECNSKITVALAVMDECFLPIIDRRSGINLIHNVIYNCGSNFNRLNFHGFYTFILEHGDEIISAASLRFHGTRLAEMPFIGTRNMYRRQGMCRRLLGGIESALCSLNIEKLIIPAISELTETWTNVFGFKPLKLSQRQEIKSVNMLVFPGTGLLQKPLLTEDSAGQSKTAEQVDKVVPESKHHRTPEVANESSFSSFVGSEPQATIKVTVQCEHEVKQRESRKGSPVSPCDVSHEPSVAPCGSQSEASNYKPLHTSAGEHLMLHPKAVYNEGLVARSKFQVDSSFETETNLLYVSTKHGSNNVKIVEAGISRDQVAVNESSGESTFNSICTSPVVIASNLQDSGMKDAVDLPVHDGNQNPKDQIVNLQPNRQAFDEDSTYNNSEMVAEPSNAKNPS